LRNEIYWTKKNINSLFPSDIFINSKYNYDKYNIYDNMNDNMNKEKISINDKRLENKGQDCRYTTFIALFYFIFIEYINNLNGNEYNDYKI